MARYTPSDHDHTVIPPLAFGEGRDNADNEVKDTDVVLNTNIEGGKVGDTVQVGSKRATWLLAKGFATRPDDWEDQYAAERRPAEPEPEADPEPEEDPVEL